MAPQQNAQSTDNPEVAARDAQRLAGHEKKDVPPPRFTWWQVAAASEAKEARQQPWTSTVDKDAVDYSKANHYTTPSGIMSYDETTN